MKSTLKSMALSLLAITMVASAGVALIYGVTKEPIAEAKRAAVESSLTMVLPEFDDNRVESVSIDDMEIKVYTATKADEVVGYAVQSATKLGYGGLITMMVGVTPEGELIDVSVLSHTETPGLGSKICEKNNIAINSVVGRSLGEIDLRVKRDGGDIDALTGATITTRAYGDALSRAYDALEMVKTKK